MRFALWNIWALIDKSLELVKVLHRCKINITCIQETKWVDTKDEEIDGYKFSYSGIYRGKNRVGILIEKELVEQVVEVRRKSDRIMFVELFMGS